MAAVPTQPTGKKRTTNLQRLVLEEEPEESLHACLRGVSHKFSTKPWDGLREAERRNLACEAAARGVASVHLSFTVRQGPSQHVKSNFFLQESLLMRAQPCSRARIRAPVGKRIAMSSWSSMLAIRQSTWTFNHDAGSHNTTQQGITGLTLSCQSTEFLSTLPLVPFEEKPCIVDA